MNISTRPHQNSDYWYSRELSAASSVSSSSQTSQSDRTEPSSVRADSDQISKRSSAPDNATVIWNREESSFKEDSYPTYGTGKNALHATDSSISDNDQESSGSVEEATQSKEGQQSSVSSSPLVQESELSDEELALVKALRKSDSEVRTHEMAHIAAGGQYITSGAQLEYRKGPDGKRYAVAGEVSIDTSPVSGDPEATVAKMRQVQRAALAPASPSSQDRKVALNAGVLASKAMSELITSQAEERTKENENRVFGEMQNSDSRRAGEMRNAAASYSKVDALPLDPEVNRLAIAV